MAGEWYYSRNETSIGPVSAHELKNLAAQGALLPTDLIWKDGMKTWVPARKFKELIFGPVEEVSPPPMPSTRSHADAQQNSPPGLVTTLRSRALSYGLIVVGLPIGYAGSYFAQSGIVRAFVSIGDYFACAPQILAPHLFGHFGKETDNGIYVTAWLGICAGAIGMGVLAMVMAGKMKTRNRDKAKF